jgi:hypothetical protein
VVPSSQQQLQQPLLQQPTAAGGSRWPRPDLGPVTTVRPHVSWMECQTTWRTLRYTSNTCSLPLVPAASTSAAISFKPQVKPGETGWLHPWVQLQAASSVLPAAGTQMRARTCLEGQLGAQNQGVQWDHTLLLPQPPRQLIEDTVLEHELQLQRALT